MFNSAYVENMDGCIEENAHVDARTETIFTNKKPVSGRDPSLPGGGFL